MRNDLHQTEQYWKRLIIDTDLEDDVPLREVAAVESLCRYLVLYKLAR